MKIIHDSKHKASSRDKVYDFKPAFTGTQESEDWRGSTKKSKLMLSIKVALIMIIFIIVVFFVMFGISTVDGESMNPTYTDGQKVIFTRFSKNYQRGAVISLKMPDGSHFIKRIVGLPGDTIDIKNGQIILNGEPLKEPYAHGDTHKQAHANFMYPYVIDDDRYFVVGDNREHSVDSRLFGSISEAQIDGIVLGY